MWLETHIELNTASKMFSWANNQDTEIPNNHIDAVTTGQMGTLPVPNPHAIEKTVILGKAIQADISNIITRDRKHYQYPDLPKWFQLTQLENPIIKWWIIKCLRENWSVFEVPLEQIHLEEDAWKLIHKKDYSLVDFNRAGRPLIEIVTKPAIHDIDDAIIYMEYLQKIVRFLDISNADMEKGHFRSDISISLRKKWSNDLNPRTEIKNLNSFKFAKNAVISEIEQQIQYYIKHNKVKQEQVTALWDEDKKEIRIMRKKENANDYRYINEPDIPAIDISKLKNKIQVDVSQLPFQCELQMIEWKLNMKEARFFSADVKKVNLFFNIHKEIQNIYLVWKFILNYLSNIEEIDEIQTTKIIKLIKLNNTNPIHTKLIKECINKIAVGDIFEIEEYVNEKSMTKNQIEEIVDTIIMNNPEIINNVEKGETNIWMLVAIAMKEMPKLCDWWLLKNIIENKLWISWNKEKKTKDKKGDTWNNNISEWYEDIEDIMEITNHERIEILRRYQSHNIEEINENNIGEELSIAWRIESIRDHWDLIFIDLRHNNNIFQVKIIRENIKDLDWISKLNKESVVLVKGLIQQRDESTYNQSIMSGTIEIDAANIVLLSYAVQLPFDIKEAQKVAENTRLTYRFLDLRNDKMADNIRKRHLVTQETRSILNERSFTEIETPILSKWSDEWSREFIVPSRQHKGKFYVLPQAPQQFKQMLMASGIHRYYQIAKCFRDEDERWDRQAEFTQIDMELSFTNEEEIRKIISDLLLSIVKKIYPNKNLLTPEIQEITYKEAMDLYGSDKPDIRFWLKMKEITDIVKKSDFKVFKEKIEEWWIVKAIKIDKRISKSDIESLTKIAQSHWLWWLAYIIINDNDLQSPIIKYLWENVATNIVNAMEAKPWDIIFFASDRENIANKALDAVRRKLGEMLNLYDKNDLSFCWIVDFPMFEKTVEWRRTFTHNPFSMPKVEDIDKLINKNDIDKIIAQQYDIVLNGNEIWWWSIRAHLPKILESTYRVMWYSTQEIYDSIWHMLKTFCYGTPPHGGIALWLDRLMMILQDEKSIRDVMAFPKTWRGEDLLFNAPSDLPNNRISDVHIKKIN